MMYLLMVAVMLVMWQLALEVGFGIFRHELHVMGIFYGLGFILIECWMLYCIRSDPAYR